MSVLVPVKACILLLPSVFGSSCVMEDASTLISQHQSLPVSYKTNTQKHAYNRAVNFNCCLLLTDTGTTVKPFVLLKLDKSRHLQYYATININELSLTIFFVC